jgi:aspartate aminotransferase
MTVSDKISAIATKSSWIRKMFEEGNRLKSIHGAENVFDFSLGNPNLLPPDAFRQALKEAACEEGPGVHSYMPNVGYPGTRSAVAKTVSTEQGVTVTENDIIMTCGAAGALNVIFKTLLNPGEEIISPVPHFVEYGFYADNHGGVLIKVPTKDDFTLDLKEIESVITPKTKVVLINSPNNPTGQIYSKESLDQLGELLREKNREFDTTIYLVSDEPYRKVVYDDAVVPGIFESYAEAIVATSYSKDISIPGERIGFLAVNPNAKYKDQLYGGLALSNRILGYVNAPALMQRVIAKVQGLSVDIDLYKRKRDMFCDGLKDAGYEFNVPPGAFYLFPKSPIADDVKFVNALQEELILTVPGSGFAGPGYFRIAYCTDDESIQKSLAGFKKVMAKFR